MYLPKHFEETRVDVMHGVIRRYPLGTLIASLPTGLVANHLPFAIDTAAASSKGVLRCHVARANPIWRELASIGESLVIFQGADAYISPSAYSTKREHGKVVPTWDYIAVHAYGRPKIVADKAWLRHLVDDLSRVHEAGRSSPWQVADAPAEYIDKMLDAIVGLEIPISKLLGKWKVSQNRSAADRAGVVADLDERAQEELAAPLRATLE